MTDSGADSPPRGDNISELINAFRHFNDAASSLNLAYRKLEERIDHLTAQLEEKDRELYTRLRERDRLGRYLHSLLESISSGVIGIDLDGNITTFNRTASELTGIPLEEALGKRYEEVTGLEPDNSPALQTLRQGPELRGMERTYPSTSARVTVGTTWVVDSDGERVGVVEIMDDVSTLRSMEEKFEQQKTLSALGEMAAAVAHELRNPLSGIGGFAALLKADLADDPPKLKLVDKLLQGVKDLEKVSTKLLFLTRRTEINQGEIDLQQLLYDLIALLKSEAAVAKREITILADFPEENVPVSADAELLKLIFTNLGRNALQAVGDSGRIEFRLAWRLFDNRVDITVADTGVGMSEEVQAKLFSPFFTTRAEGTGLGLALVKKALDLHRGKVTVKSQEGKGSEFCVSLPIRSLKNVESVSHGH